MLRHRALPALLAALAILLMLPALGAGWQLDDHWQRFVMLGKAQPDVSPMRMFSILRGDLEENRRYRDRGVLPWWTPDDFTLCFLRPFSVLTHMADYRLWPDHPALMHLHSLIWFGLVVASAALLFRQITGPTAVAGLAAVLYAADDAHALPAAWIANRNALLAALFGILSILAHHRWRKDGWKPGAFASPLLLGLGLLSGEGALAALAYLAAHALFLDPGRWRARIGALLPGAAVFLAYAAVYRVLGFGARGSGFYQDPMEHPVRFLEVLARRGPSFLIGQWTPVPADLVALLPAGAEPAFWLAGALLLAGLVWLFLPLLRRDAVARFWAFGSILSVVPVSATVPSNRLLFFVGLGAMPLLARFLADLRSGSGWLPQTRGGRLAARAAGLFFAATHLVLAPLAMPFGAWSLRHDLEAPVNRAMAGVPNGPELARQDLVIVNSADYLTFVSAIPVQRALQNGNASLMVRALSAGPVPLELTRLDASTLRLRPRGPFFAGLLGRVYRSEERPFRAGDVVRLGGMRVEVTVADARGDPREIVFRFNVPLEDPSLRWLAWEEGRYVPFQPPQVGQSVALPPARGPFERLWSAGYLPGRYQ